jgi:hypothetical protein
MLTTIAVPEEDRILSSLIPAIRVTLPRRHDVRMCPACSC